MESGVKGTRITATARAAEKAGAAIGQMLTDARAACPEIVAAQAEPELDAAFLERLGHWAMRYSPVVALDSTDGLLIDTTGCDHLFGGEEAMVDDVVMRFEKIGLSVRTGLADTPGAAWGLARFGARMPDPTISPLSISPPGQTLAATAPLPVEALRLDEKVLLLLQRLGLKTIGALRTIPRPALERRFRSREAVFSVQLRLDQMAGNIREPLSPLKEVPPFREMLACPEPAIETGAISIALDHLLQKMKSRLENEGLGARSLTLTACHSDGGSDRLSITLGRATRDPGHIAKLFRDRLEQIDPGFGIDLFVLAANRVEEMTEQQQSLATRRILPENVIPLIDRLMNRLGAEHITRLQPVASHLPERAQQVVHAAEEAIVWDVIGPDMPAARPFRLFDQPEAIETIAEVPDGPPLQFIWRRLSRKIIRARGPERIAPEWWRKGDGPLLLITNARDYYEVEDAEGARYWLFRAGLYGEMRHAESPRWFIHGLFG